MFRCTSCGQIDNFSLMLSANYTGPGVFSQKINEHGEIIINIDGYEFIPDLAFMNSHSVCKFCGQIQCFEYYFESVAGEQEEEMSKFPDKPNIEIDQIPKKHNESKKRQT